MVKKQDKNTAKRQENQEEADCPAKASKIGSSTAYSYCGERLSPFGGLLGLVKFMELIRFKEIFEGWYTPPSRTPDMGHHNYGVWFYNVFVYWVQPGMAFSVYPDRLNVVFDISGGKTSICYDILAICEFSGDKSRQVSVDGNECAERAGMACMRDRVRDDPH